MQKLHHAVNPIQTPQTQPIPGRSDQVVNAAGGYGWEVTPLAQLHRFLVLGTAGGTFYASERQSTLQAFDGLNKALAENPAQAINLIAEISESGRAPRNDPALFALAVAASHEDEKVRALALDALPRVARIATHLFHFTEFLTARNARRRGWGPALRKAIGRWYNAKDPLRLAHQITKYQSRDGWSHRDLLRLAHPKGITPSHDSMFRLAVGKVEKDDDVPVRVRRMEPEAWRYLGAVRSLTADMPVGKAAELITEFRLPREVIPTELLQKPEVWEALLQDMPITALIRNLATMTRIGLIAPMSGGTSQAIALLTDTERVKRSRVHPMQILMAMITYQSGQSGEAGGFARERKTWEPVTQVLDALDGAFYQAFDNVQPTGKRTYLALDSSGSMHGGYGGYGYGRSRAPIAWTPATLGCAMAMVTARTEPNYVAALFDQSVYGFPALTPRSRLDAVLASHPGRGAGTDISLPFKHAISQKLPIDVFLIYTDGQTWAGNQHPSQALKQYQQATGIGARAVEVMMVSNAISVADPKSPDWLTVVGFDASTPEVIAGFSRGEF